MSASLRLRNCVFHCLAKKNNHTVVLNHRANQGVVLAPDPGAEDHREVTAKQLRESIARHEVPHIDLQACRILIERDRERRSGG